MRILLLQDEIYLPSLGGGTKANRCLLEALVSLGHDCLALTPALTSSPDGPNNPIHFRDEMRSRNVVVRLRAGHVSAYEYQGVQVEAVDSSSTDFRRDHGIRRIQEFQPDWVLVADDKRRFMLEAAMQAASDRVILVIQTIMQLPFGPLAVHECRQQAGLMEQARAILVISNYLKQYLEQHSGLHSRLLPLPVYGPGPFPCLSQFDAGFVTLINPCELKGVGIFLSLAREYPHVRFAAVPTWGADDLVLRKLKSLPNVQILEPADDIEQILARTRILLVPSLWPETFGYVVPEAMLRGIPVMASDIGGLPEAKLGVDYLLPVAPAERRGGKYVSPPQDTAPWSEALGELLFDSKAYYRCARASREAALKYVSRITPASFDTLLTELARRNEENN